MEYFLMILNFGYLTVSNIWFENINFILKKYETYRSEVWHKKAISVT